MTSQAGSTQNTDESIAAVTLPQTHIRWTPSWYADAVEHVRNHPRYRQDDVRMPDLLALAGSVNVPAARRDTPWSEVLRQTRQVWAAASQ